MPGALTLSLLAFLVEAMQLAFLNSGHLVVNLVAFLPLADCVNLLGKLLLGEGLQ